MADFNNLPIDPLAVADETGADIKSKLIGVDAHFGRGRERERDNDSLRTALEQLLTRVQDLETQIASYAENQNQSLIAQVISKQNALEKRLNVMRKEVDGQLADMNKKIETRPTGPTATPILTNSTTLRSSANLAVHNHQESLQNLVNQTEMGTETQTNSDWEEEELEEVNSGYYHSSLHPPVKVEIREIEMIDIDIDTEEEAYCPSSSPSSLAQRSSTSTSNSKRGWCNFSCKFCPRSAATEFRIFENAEELAKHYTIFHSILDHLDKGQSTQPKSSIVSSSTSSRSNSSTRTDSTTGAGTNQAEAEESNGGIRIIHNHNPHQVQKNVGRRHSDPQLIPGLPEAFWSPLVPIPPPAGCIDIDMEEVDPKSYHCLECGKNFKRQDLLRKHTLYVHQRRGQVQPRKKRRPKRVICTVCGRSVSCGGLKGHMEIHSTDRQKIYCQICGAGCISKEGFEYHMRKHKGEKPFACPHCPRTFTSKGNRRNHIMTHLGKPHVCDVCGKSYARPSALKKHKDLEHRIVTGDSGPIWVKEGLTLPGDDGPN